MVDKSEWKTPSRKRREGRWTPIRAKAQDTRAIAIPNSPRDAGHWTPTGIEPTDYDDDDSGNIPRTSPHFCEYPQSALEFCPIHCPNGRLGQDLGFGGSAFALKLPELLNRNLVAVRAKLGQTSCFPNGPQIWCLIGQ